jgi:addiction module HigA family antidote
MATRKTALSVVKAADKADVKVKPVATPKVAVKAAPKVATKAAPKAAPKVSAPAVKTAPVAVVKKVIETKPAPVVTAPVAPVVGAVKAPKVERVKKERAPKVATVPVGAAGVFLAAKMVETGHTEATLGKALGVLPRRIRALLGGERRITADSALRLAVHFGDDPLSWMRFQCEAELAEARTELGTALAAIKPYAAA